MKKNPQYSRNRYCGFFMSVVVLVVEVPADTKSEYALVERVVWCKEVVGLALSCIDMTHHHEESRALQVEVGINIHDRVVAHFCAIVARLNGILSESRAVVGCVILCEESCIGSEVAFQHTRNLESEEQIGVDVEVGHGQSHVVRRLLVRNDIVPMQRSEFQLLLQFERQQTYCTALLHNAQRVAGASEVVSHVISHCKERMVLDVVEGNANGCLRLLVAELALNACVYYLRHVVIVPPEVL